MAKHFEEIAKLYDAKDDRFVWAHNLVTLHYSDDDTDYPVFFQLWKPVDLETLEQGLVAAKVPLRESKQRLKTEAADKWKAYLDNVTFGLVTKRHSPCIPSQLVVRHKVCTYSRPDHESF
jgi:hypothetical protein